MGAGAILIGMAALVLLVAYVMQPFRRSSTDLDAAIERWVADARKGEAPAEREASRAPVPSEDAPSVPVATAITQEPSPGSRSSVAAFCHNCGKPVRRDHHFCPHCGTRLEEV